MREVGHGAREETLEYGALPQTRERLAGLLFATFEAIFEGTLEGAGFRITSRLQAAPLRSSGRGRSASVNIPR